MVDVRHQSKDNSTYTLHLHRADAARYISEVHGIPCTTWTLFGYECNGGGPAFRKVKFPIYHRDDLDTWARSRLSEPASD
jgi:hypothetical protein